MDEEGKVGQRHGRRSSEHSKHSMLFRKPGGQMTQVMEGISHHNGNLDFIL